MKTVIMAGGKGTRIAEIFPDIPKPLIPIQDETGVQKPVLQWEIENLRDQGFKDIILTLGYRAGQIQEFFGDGSNFGVHIDYYIEERPLGNAGALFKIRSKIGDEPFLLLNADAVFNIDFNRMVRFHKDHNALVTLFTHPNSHPYDSGIVIVNEDKSVASWLTKEDSRQKAYANRVNAGLHIIDPVILDQSGVDGKHVGEEKNGEIYKIDLDRMILKPLCGKGNMFAYDSPEYCKDMGTPERYAQVSQDFRSGIVTAKSFKHKQKAIFLDRDGTINTYVGFLRSPSEMELIDGAAKAIQRINNSEYLAIVVTNQPVIARGEVTVQGLREIHKTMETLLGEAGAYIDALYYCPHHPHKGYEGEVSELKIDCDCRKPKPGMLIKAANDFNLSLNESWMVGDGENDIKAGKAAGCHTALIGSKDYGQNITANSLLTAIEEILRK